MELADRPSVAPARLIVDRITLFVAVAAAAAGYVLGAAVEAGRNRPAEAPVVPPAAAAPLTDAEIEAMPIRFAADVAHMALEGGNPALAAKIYDRVEAAETAPAAEVLVGHALALRRLNRFEDAAVVLHKALVLHPGAPLVRYHAGLAALHAGEESVAADHLAAFVALAPDHPNAAGARATVEAIRRKGAS